MSKWLAENMPVVTGLVTAMVALFGIVLTTVSLIMTGRQNKAHRAAMKEDREAAKLQFEAQRDAMQADQDAALSDRFSRVIERLSEGSLPVRLGTLFELKKLGEESKSYRPYIVEVLSTFVREHIENEEYWYKPNKDERARGIFLPSLHDDVHLAGEILSELYKTNNELRASLGYLYAKGLYLGHLQLHGADLKKAVFQGARLHHTDLQNASLIGADFREATFFDANLAGADFGYANSREPIFGSTVQKINTNISAANFIGANVQTAKNLTVKQLLTAQVDDTTLLDPSLRAEYNRLKAEHTA